MSPWQDEHWDTAQNKGEVWLHRALLGHPWRVLDPDDADLFYIPMYPVLSIKLLGMDGKTCAGLTHRERMHTAVSYLERESKHFRRYGGSDHVWVCAWWKCHSALDASLQMRLARTIVGINEPISYWAKRGCRHRLVTIPYTSSSTATTVDRIGGRPAEERTVPFFFAGTGRKRAERLNLKVVRDVFPESTIEVGEHPSVWAEDAAQYSDTISRSRFCLCPRGDTLASRRFFDAVAAGCIPVMTTAERDFLPFLKNGLDYSEFTVVAREGSFDTEESVKLLVEELASMSDKELQPIRQALERATSSVVYGVTDGSEFEDMQPYHNVFTLFAQEAWRTFVGEGASDISDGNIWTCSPAHRRQDEVASRAWAPFPESETVTQKSDDAGLASASYRSQWLHQSETIVDADRKLLFCAPPNTGSTPFRMLAKRMKDARDWGITNRREKLFGPDLSGLSLLDVSNSALMEEIYSETGSGWIKIAVVRDPVTRLLSAFLDTKLKKSPKASAGEEEMHDHGRRRTLRAGPAPHYAHGGHTARTAPTQQRKTGAESFVPTAGVTKRKQVSSPPLDAEGISLQRRVSGTARDESHQRSGGDTLPSFEDFVDIVHASKDIWNVSAVIRPWSSLCGLGHAAFDSIIPFESLEKTSVEVLKSLPGGLWGEYGSSGWGPTSGGNFMQYDYGGANPWLGWSGSGQENELPRRAEDLFVKSSCDWTEFYTEESTLQKVWEIYAADYALLGWYSIEAWKAKLIACQAT